MTSADERHLGPLPFIKCPAWESLQESTDANGCAGTVWQICGSTHALRGAAALQAEAAAAREVEASQRAMQAAQEAAEVRDLAQREAAAHESAQQEASQKAARLARLEGMRPA